MYSQKESKSIELLYYLLDPFAFLLIYNLGYKLKSRYIKNRWKLKN
jgi:hypothetical protein